MYETFKKDWYYLQGKYYKGIDEMLEKDFDVKTYDKVCYSIQNNEYEPKNKDYSIMLFNQRQFMMEPGWSGWWSNYFLPR